MDAIVVSQGSRRQAHATHTFHAGDILRTARRHGRLGSRVWDVLAMSANTPATGPLLGIVALVSHGHW